MFILTDEEKCTIKASYIQQLTDLKVLLCDTCSLTEFIENFETSHVRNISVLSLICLPTYIIIIIILTS